MDKLKLHVTRDVSRTEYAEIEVPRDLFEQVASSRLGYDFTSSDISAGVRCYTNLDAAVHFWIEDGYQSGPIEWTVAHTGVDDYRAFIVRVDAEPQDDDG